MRCTECGARYQNRSLRCPECGARQNEVSSTLSAQTQPQTPIVTEPAVSKAIHKQTPSKTSTSLLEFPGVNRAAMPEWRREVGDRVRERQEKRAREAVLEATEAGTITPESDPSVPMLELLPQAEVAPVNPIVAAALRRIERANLQGPGVALATAIAYEEPALELEQIPTTLIAVSEGAKPERFHNLAVVPTLEPITDTPVAPNVRPRRVIDELNCSSLNYLDSISTAVTLETNDRQSAPFLRRIFGAIVDLVFMALLTAPLFVLAGVTSPVLPEPRVIGFLAGSFLLIGFLYLTISTGFTGRTLGMKLSGLRVVDARTGLIPTGSQSAGRSLIFMLSLVTADLVMLYALIDREKLTLHDRFTRTTVIRA
jgi:uncharacterized RDD family membrane protein YckC